MLTLLYILSTRLQMLFHQVPLGVPLAAEVETLVHMLLSLMCGSLYIHLHADKCVPVFYVFV